MQAESIYEQWCSKKNQNPQLRVLDIANERLCCINQIQDKMSLYPQI